MLPLPETPVSLTIDRLGQLGEGVASWQGRTVFIPGAFPGDTVRVHLESQGRVLRGLLREVVSPGPDRRVAPCSLASECGGCDWLGLAESAQRSAKQEIVLSTLEHLGHLRREDFTVRPLLVAPRDWGYRRRTVLHPAGKGALGYFSRRSHERLAVSECGALTPVLTALPGKLAPLLKPLAKDTEEVLLLAEGDKAAFAVNLTGQVTARHVEAAEAAVRALRLEGAVLVPKEGSPRVLGKPALRSYSPLRPEVPLYLRPDSFAQAHAEANVGLVTSAIFELAARDEDSVLELYSGNGNFTFPLAAGAASVLGVESSPVGVELAQRSAREAGVGNVRFVQGDARKVCDGLVSEGRRFDVCLADPPRAGAPGLVKWMVALGIRRVVYVACDPASLARDAAGLVEAGYKPQALQVVDMFPQTHHVEAVMSFERPGTGKGS